MNTSLNDFQAGSVNWRAQIALNKRRTIFVMLFFTLTYAGVGLLIDVALLMMHYPNYPIYTYLHALGTFQHFPIATAVLILIAAGSIAITLLLQNRLMLFGTQYREITETNAQTQQETQLFNIIEEMKIASGLNFRPRVFIIDAEYLNAFASGYSERSACIAVTTALLNVLNREELQAVIAHEMAHIRHLDIRLTLMASVLANLTLIVLDIAIRLLAPAMFRRDDRKNNSGLVMIQMILFVLRIVLPIMNMVVLLYLSRTREYMADAGAVQFTRDHTPLARALLKIQQYHQKNGVEAYQYNQNEGVRQQAYIYYPKLTSSLFSTHPDMESRLKALGYVKKEITKE